MMHPRQVRRLVRICVSAGLLLTAQVALADDGDEMCNKKSLTYQMFDALTKSWTETGRSCTPPGPEGPVNGEQRCGFAGYVLKYRAKSRVWLASQQHCDGSKPYIGWRPLEK